MRRRMAVDPALRLAVTGNADLAAVRAAILKVDGVTDLVRVGRGDGRVRSGAGA